MYLLTNNENESFFTNAAISDGIEIKLYANITGITPEEFNLNGIYVCFAP